MRIIVAALHLLMIFKIFSFLIAIRQILHVQVEEVFNYFPLYMVIRDLMQQSMFVGFGSIKCFRELMVLPKSRKCF